MAEFEEAAEKEFEKEERIFIIWLYYNLIINILFQITSKFVSDFFSQQNQNYEVRAGLILHQ